MSLRAHGVASVLFLKVSFLRFRSASDGWRAGGAQGSHSLLRVSLGFRVKVLGFRV